MNFANFTYEAVPFDSQIYMEVYYNQDCMDKYPYSEIEKLKVYAECVYVHFTFQGFPLKLQDCVTNNQKKGLVSEDCFYSDFLVYMNKIS